MTEKTETNETAAADTLRTTPVTRTNLLQMIVQNAAGLNWEDLSTLAASLQNGQAAAAAAPDAAAQNAGSIAAKGDPMASDGMVKATREDLEKTFEGSQLSEEMKEKATTLFEAAVSARVAVERTAIEEEAASLIEQTTEAIKEEMVENVDKFLDYIAKEWMEENRVAIGNDLKLDLFANFLDAQKKLFQEHYIEIPDDKLDVLADTVQKVEVLEGKLNEQITKNADLTRELTKLQAADVFAEASEGLALTDVEKFKTLASDLMEGASDVQDLKKKLLVIKESHFAGDKKAPAKATKVLNEGDVIEVKTEVEAKTPVATTPEMAAYTAAISRTVRKV